MSKKRHKHKFVPIEVSWYRYWSVLEEHRFPEPAYLTLACECGDVKLVPAKLATFVEREKEG